MSVDLVRAVVPMGEEVEDIAGAWGDGHVGLDDFTAPAAAALDGLGVFLDPVNWVLGKLLEPIIEWILDNVPPCKQAMDYITGDIASIQAYAKQFQVVSQKTADETQQLVEGVNELLTSWTGDGRAAFRAAAAEAVELKKSIASSTHDFSNAVYALAGIVAAVKQIVVALIKELVTDLVEKGILAAAAAVPSLGSAIAAYGAWAAAKYALVMGKVARWLQKLFERAAAIAQKLGLKGTTFLKVSGMFEKLAARFDEMLSEATRASSLKDRARTRDEAAQRHRDSADDHYGRADEMDGRKARTERRQGDTQTRKADQDQSRANQDRRDSMDASGESGADPSPYAKAGAKGGGAYDDGGQEKMGSDPADEVGAVIS